MCPKLPDGRQDLEYISTFIQVATDSPVDHATVPVLRGEKKSIPVIEYELLADAPHRLTQPEVLFETHVRHKGVPVAGKAARQRAWDEFFATSHACLRASPLAKKYGWGFHFDAQGRVALVAVESAAYKRLAKDGKLQQLPAMRGKKA
jgi:hypothetical protein